MTLYTEGFGRFVTSTTAPIATGWSDSCRVGISPTERTRLARRTARLSKTGSKAKLRIPRFLALFAGEKGEAFLAHGVGNVLLLPSRQIAVTGVHQGVCDGCGSR